MVSVNPALTPAALEWLLESTAVDLGMSGYDSAYGFGRINAQAAVEAARDYTPVPDTTPPSVSISSPADGAVVSGMIAVIVSASDNVGVVKVEFYIDGRLVATDTAELFPFTWDTTQWTNGSHTLQAKAYDGGGNSNFSPPVTVTVPNADMIPPDVSITSPVDGATVTKTVKISVRASDAGKVQQVQVLLDHLRLSGLVEYAPVFKELAFSYSHSHRRCRQQGDYRRGLGEGEIRAPGAARAQSAARRRYDSTASRPFSLTPKRALSAAARRPVMSPA